MKTLFSAAIALVLGITALVAPAGHTQPRRGGGTSPHLVAGTVVSVKLGTNKMLASFVIKGQDGKTHTFKVTASTKYRKDSQATTSATVKKGSWVVVALPKAGVSTAVGVMVRGSEVYIGGTIVSTKAGSNKKLASFVIKDWQGKTVTIKVTPKTKHTNAGKPATAAIIKKGAQVGVMLPKSGVFQAVRVIAGMRWGSFPRGGGMGGPRGGQRPR